ncbi:MAG: MerR family transcriptional regulator [Chloroflexota bacterium]
MKRTVKQLARLAGITPRALHYYDEIDLLPPSAVGENGYRYYDDSATLRLQQIMFYRELGLSLTDIKGVLDDPGFEIRQALLAHREALQEQAQRISTLIKTIDKTLVQLEGEQEMDAEELFGGFDNAQERQWSQEAINQYGAHDSYVQESARRWRSYTAADKAGSRKKGTPCMRNWASMLTEIRLIRRFRS